jgi:hypothetical protein
MAFDCFLAAAWWTVTVSHAREQNTPTRADTALCSWLSLVKDFLNTSSHGSRPSSANSQQIPLPITSKRFRPPVCLTNMSAADGTPQTSDPIWPVQKDVNGHNNWTKDSKIKTAKCGICNDRVRQYAWQCDWCRKRICSECAEDDGKSTAAQRYQAHSHLSEKCGCAWPSGQKPGLQQVRMLVVCCVDVRVLIM